MVVRPQLLAWPLLLAAALAIGSPAPAASLEPPELLAERPGSPAAPESDHAAVVRSRSVIPDLASLRGKPSRMRLTLFEDAAFVVRLEPPEPTPSGGFVRRGQVEGRNGGSVLLSVQDDALVADISVPGRGEFRIRPHAGGGHVVRQIDAGAPWSCGGDPAPQPAPAPSLPTRGAGACPDDGSVIDILVVYTAQARASAGGTSAMLARINQVVAYTNQAYVNSDIDTAWNVIETMEIPYVEDGDIFVELGRVRVPNDGHMDEVPVRRDAIGADVVSLFVNGNASGSWCGVAASIGPANPDFAYNVVRRSCPTATFAHEVGHNAGGAHEGCNASYNHAHIVPGQFATIMKSVLSGLIQHHSNPDVLYQGTPTGVPPGQTCAAHNALTINDNAWAMANHRCSFVDCNMNGVLDVDDIALGTSDDCNGDEIPDECQADCNANGVQDQCDISAGTSQDCNGDNVPDECQPDCNSNGIQDDCDISAGTSDDCNQNGIPDECDFAAGTSLDCNANGVPDECDVFWIGTSSDCNQNWIPDECEPDCNANGIADECDIAEGTSADCNVNAVPDECDLLSGTSVDTDHSGVPDECEDCDDNGVTDSVDIAGGALPDTNSNGVPDPCEKVHNVTRSKYHLTIQLGLDGAGDGDRVDVAPGIYMEAIDFLGKRVQLRGTGGPQLTTIDGTGQGRSTVLMSAAQGPGPGQGEEFPLGGILGFTITGGEGTPEMGGERRGGGIYLAGGLLSNVHNCIVTGNTADRGAGLFVTGAGGATGGGGAVVNAIFHDNLAAVEGGAIYVDAGSYLEVHSSTFHQNSAGSAAGAIFGPATVSGSVFWSNGLDPLQPPMEAFVQYSDVEGGAAGTGNIDADPRFVDAASGDYRLLPVSPAIDAVAFVTGTDFLDLDQDADIYEAIPLDIGLAPRSQDGDGNAEALPDMGAHEMPLASSPPPPIPDGSGNGQPVLLDRLDAAGSEILITWDDVACPPQQAKILYGALDEVSNLLPTGALCGIGNPTLFGSSIGGDLWFLIVADNTADEEGSWGLSSTGERNGAQASGWCDGTVKVLTATCP